MRLESDQNLVQIATIHKAKGLEWPIVFCPFLWDGFLLSRRTVMDSKEYHDEGGAAVIDFRTGDEYAPHETAIKAQMKLEDSAELLRLAYVALTRGVYRCYLVAGTYGTHSKLSPSESCGSLLNWLVAGNGQAPEAWFTGRRTPDEIAAAWKALADARHPHIQLAPLPAVAGTPVALDRPAADSLIALTPPARIANAWRIGSFSALANGAVNETAATDHDARSASVARVIGLPPAGLPPDDILRFPRGSNAGDCLDAVFERIDFTDPSDVERRDRARTGGAPAIVAGRTIAHRKGRAGGDDRAHARRRDERRAAAGRYAGIDTVGRGASPSSNERSAGDVSAAHLNRLLAKLGYAVPRLAPGSLEGYLKGFIDLVFEHDGRFYVLDWKSNHLGYTPDDYGHDAIEAAMVEHGYHLQHLIYSLALDRYLAHRLAGYDYDRHFGGVLYLFIRGVRPQWMKADGTPAGIFQHRPARTTLAQLDQLFGNRARKQTA